MPTRLAEKVKRDVRLYDYMIGADIWKKKHANSERNKLVRKCRHVCDVCKHKIHMAMSTTHKITDDTTILMYPKGLSRHLANFLPVSFCCSPLSFREWRATRVVREERG